MTEPADFIGEPEPDAVLEGLLAPLKQMEPSLDARVRNRVAIAEALRRQREMDRQRSRPWWARRLSIPVPIAAALLIASGLALAVGYRGAWKAHAAPMAVHEQPAHRGPVALASEKGATYHAVETYLCGVGRLNSESGYFIQE